MEKELTPREMRERLALADEVFKSASSLLAKLGDPTDAKNKRIQNEMLALEHTTWRYAAHG